jgi:hypothetical protein
LRLQHVPALVQTVPAAHGFWILPPQPSSKEPHCTAAAAGGSAGVQGGPHLPFVLHTWPVAHVPQLMRRPPQALVMLPHSRPCAAHSASGSGGPQRLAMPPVAQAFPAGHSPHETLPPQPLDMNPHCAPASAHSCAGVLVGQVFGSQRLLSPLHTEVAAQVPQFVN